MPNYDNTAEFLGLNFQKLTLQQAAAAVHKLARGPKFSYVVTPNVDHVVQLHKSGADAVLVTDAYREATLCLCDSQVLALLGRISGIELEVVAGSDLTAQLVRENLPDGTRVALVGGDEAQRDWLAGCWPMAQIVQHRPPFGLRHNATAREEAANFIEMSDSDVVLLTVGAPQSEMIANLVKSRGRSRGVALCVGASLEFLTGAKRRAPAALQRWRLEWAFRLVSEPGRLWRRYLAEGPLIFSIWLRWQRTHASG